MAVALVLAAGLGERLGVGVPKALVDLAGRPLLAWSLGVLAGAEQIDGVVVAVPTPEDPRWSSACERPVSQPQPVLVRGGRTRSESVRRALAAVERAGDGAVLVHDAARPLVSAELVRKTLAAAQREGVDAAIAAAPVTDTVKQTDAEGLVLRTLDRSGLWAVQTPQVFRREALERALDVPEQVLAEATDDAWLVERAGGRVAIVPAPRENLKVTTPLDLELARLLLSRRHGPSA